MSSVFRQVVSRPVPKSATIVRKNGKTFAKWTPRGGRVTLAEVVDGRISVPVLTWSARFKDQHGDLIERSTGCKDKQSAQSMLAKWEREAELVRSGVLSNEQASIASKATAPVSEHLAAYNEQLQARQVSRQRSGNKIRQIELICSELKWTKLTDFNGEALVKWLNAQKKIGKSAATRNDYRAAMVSFANWCCSGVRPRMLANPFSGVPKANEALDVRRKRRALTPEELERLVLVSRWRPLAEYGRISIQSLVSGKEPHKRANWTKGPISPDILSACVHVALKRATATTIDRLDNTGKQRALIVKTLALTGLRKGELASLTVGQLVGDRLELSAKDEKNRKGSSIPLREDLAEDLREWAAGKPSTDKLFYIPTGYIRILDRDLSAAGIEKRDERGFTIDVHALRHTFGTLLSAGGVAPRTAQAAMRHSSIDLTMNVYTDPKFLDVSAALAALPGLTVDRPDPIKVRRKRGR